MLSRRNVLCGLSAAAVMVAIPSMVSAAGRGNEGDNGNGNGGNGNGSNGNGGGSNGNGEENGNGGNGNDKSNGNSKTAAPTQVAPSTTVDPATLSLRVRHNNGFEEILSGGRYHMKDNRGRTIVNRPATGEDLVRLQQLTGG
jgi:hypothetical protein